MSGALLKILWPGVQLIVTVAVVAATLVLQGEHRLSAAAASSQDAETLVLAMRSESAAQGDSGRFNLTEQERLMRLEVKVDGVLESIRDIKQHLSEHRDWLLYLVVFLVGGEPALKFVRGVRSPEARRLFRKEE